MSAHKKDPLVDITSRRGVAHRADNYRFWYQAASDFAGLETNRCQIQTAIAYGTPELSWQARSLLFLLISHLSPASIAEGKSTVWPCTQQIMAAFGCSDRAIRHYKAELEEKGFILRHYDRRNRPLHHRAFDLAPFLTRLPSILQSIDQQSDERRRKWQRTLEERNDLFAAEVEETCRLESNKSQTSESVTSMIENTSVTAAISAIELSPQVKALLSTCALEQLSAGNPQLVFQEIATQIDRLLPQQNGKRSNARIWQWAANRFGCTAIERLVVAIEDPKVHDPARFFGWLATTTDPVDLTKNLERLRNGECRLPVPEPLPEPQAPVPRALYKRFGAATFDSWFRDTTMLSNHPHLLIYARTDFATEWIRNHFWEDLNLTAKALGYGSVEVRTLPSDPGEAF